MAADRRVIDGRRCEVEFYRNLLVGFRSGDLIFDIGANDGFKTDIFLRLGARVVAVEPDKSNQTILADKFLKYRLIKRPVSIVPKAVSSKNGCETFWINEPGSPKNTLNEKWVKILQVNETKFGRQLDFRNTVIVETVTLEDLIIAYGSPFFVKIDVEGYELSVLEGMRQSVPYLSFEVNLPEFKNEGLKCLNLLKGLSPYGLFNYSIDEQTHLAAPRWMDATAFQWVLANCAGNSVEVFWRSAG
jgi:FkbM family methyltransferase